jgi:hypothetical protein
MSRGFYTHAKESCPKLCTKSAFSISKGVNINTLTRPLSVSSLSSVCWRGHHQHTRLLLFSGSHFMNRANGRAESMVWDHMFRRKAFPRFRTFSEMRFCKPFFDCCIYKRGDWIGLVWREREREKGGGEKRRERHFFCVLVRRMNFGMYTSSSILQIETMEGKSPS